MKNILLISLAASSLLAAENVVLDEILVESTLSEVNTEQVQSADTAEILAKEVPGISLVRRSGVANDIILRGQKNDNINVIVDGGKIYGACPNRMDPPTSHVITPNIGTINVIEGPYDVEHAGTLSGYVAIDTVAPEKGFHGDFNVGFGSFAATNVAGTLTGGNDMVQALIGVSGQWSDQYVDGDGNTFAEQINNAIAAGQASMMNAYAPAYVNHSAYDKKSILGKVNFDITENIHWSFGYTGNRGKGILYPNSMMDAQFDNSDLYNTELKFTDLGSLSKALSLKYYYSYVDHSMGTDWRRAAMMMGAKTNHLTDTIQGATVKNTTALTDTVDLTIGLDGSLRNWNGWYEQNGTYTGPSINEADTTNAAVFAELQKRYVNGSVKLGMRYDDSKIKSGNAALSEKSYTSFGANIFADYSLSDSLGLFGGFGVASRVPDGKELFLQKGATYVGTPTLDQTSNYEVDLGMKNVYSAFNLKTRVFYSMLKNYIYYDAALSANNYVNIDAHIYGIEMSGSWFMSDKVYLDFSAAAQRGRKDDTTPNQTNKNLADIPPLRGRVALNWNYSDENFVSAEVSGSDKWRNIDNANGEQKINSWAVVNLRLNHRITHEIGMIIGIDNLFDETYAVSNSYKGLTLLTGANGTMLLNEPGRNFYANFTYNF